MKRFADQSDDEIFEKQMYWKFKLQNYLNLKDNLAYFRDCRIASSLLEDDSDDWSTPNDDDIKEAESQYHHYNNLLKERENKVFKKKFSVHNVDDDVICAFCDTKNNGNRDNCSVCGGELDFGQMRLPITDHKDNDNMSWNDHNESIGQKDNEYEDNDTNVVCQNIIPEECFINDIIDTYETNGEVSSDDNKYVYSQGLETNNNCPCDTNIWKCQKCTYINKIDTEDCEACGPSVSYNDWSIVDPEYDEDNLVGCFDFFITRSPDFKSDRILLHKWMCNKCDSFNSMNLVSCETCTKNISKDCKWQCQHCTFNNKITASKCETCSTDNEAIIELKALFHNKTKWCSLM